MRRQLLNKTQFMSKIDNIYEKYKSIDKMDDEDKERVYLIYKYFYKLANFINLKYRKYKINIMAFSLVEFINHRTVNFLMTNDIGGWLYHSDSERIYFTKSHFKRGWWFSLSKRGNINSDSFIKKTLSIGEENEYEDLFKQFFKDLEIFNKALPIIFKLKIFNYGDLL